MLRHDPRSSHAETTPIGASKPLRFARTTRTDAFGSLAQQVFCLVIREDDSNWSIKTTPVRKYNANDVFDSLAQQVFCLVSEIRPRFVDQNMLRHDPRSSHARTTPIGASKPLRFASTTRTDVFDSLAQQVFCLVIREDDSNWSIKTTPVPKYNANRRVLTPLRNKSFASFLRSDRDLSVRNMLRHDPRSSHAKTTPIAASKSLRHDPRSSMPGRLQLEHQNHSDSQVQREPMCVDSLRNKSFASYFVKISYIRSRFVTGIC
ncbi:uncharacterized protein G2W53_010320 [Senna tora]|uniref:Uncharacterized protein n=1 Tax=Senna tora TaxID=362788 RepID=A0A834WZN9_9FABA|nr:uncharacterized protein G2W53_010320 [Senna tora]